MFGFPFSGFYAVAQNIDSTIAIYANEYGQERTYLHYDKSTYVPGETIWFKAYLMEGIFIRLMKVKHFIPTGQMIKATCFHIT